MVKTPQRAVRPQLAAFRPPVVPTLRRLSGHGAYLVVAQVTAR